MRRIVAALIAAIAVLVVFHHAPAQSPRGPKAGKKGGRPGIEARLARAGVRLGMPAPDVTVYRPDGTPVAFPTLATGGYTVFVGACLTCPAFLSSHPETEAVHRDYSPKGVRFYYYYRALAHPENNAYIKPFSLEERLLHVAEAERRLQVEIPFIADNMDNDLKHALGGVSNPEFLFDPEGKLVYFAGWNSGRTLRQALAELVGPVEPPTKVSDLDLPAIQRPMRMKASGVVPRVLPPDTPLLRPVKVEPLPSKDPFYMKLRAEAQPELLESGKGRLYLGFHPDPIHRVYWNNLTEPIRFDIEAPRGATVTPSSGKGPKVDSVASDSDPREFLVDVEARDLGAPLELSTRYYACHEKWCRPIRQSYRITLEVDPDGGGVIDRSFRPRPGAPGGPGDPLFVSRLMRGDLNGDGKLSRDEIPHHIEREFDLLDANRDGYIEPSEMTAETPGRR